LYVYADAATYKTVENIPEHTRS